MTPRVEMMATRTGRLGGNIMEEAVKKVKKDAR